MKRLDQLLVELGLAPTRSKAQQMLKANEIEIRVGEQWRTEASPSFKADQISQEDVRIAANSQTLKYVSRGGLKLESALAHLGLRIEGYRCFDVGQSTGGFTDCLLKSGAEAILGVDVGHDQLHPSIKANQKVLAFEGVHAKEMGHHQGILDWLKQGVQLAVVDVSFISLESILPSLGEILPLGTKLLALVKPQFEVGRGGLDKGGIVTDNKLFDEVRDRMLLALTKYGFKDLDYFPCAVKGQDGNQEFFVFAIRC